MDDASATPRQVAVARSLAVLGNASRLSLLEDLRTPKALNELRLRDATAPPDAPSISRQAIRQHLDRLLEIGAVVARDADRPYGTTVEYFLNHQALFALGEELRALARLRPQPELVAQTVGSAPAFAGGRTQGPCLVLVKGLDEGRTFPLKSGPSGGRWTIGRRRELAVTLDFDPFVSAEHAQIVFEKDAHWLVDLVGSRNGTTLNFEPIPKGAPQKLRTSDVIGMGRCLLLYRQD